MVLQPKYILKFATDGAILTKTKNAVQSSMKIIPCDVNGRVLINSNVYQELDKEITLYYFIGKCTNYEHRVGNGNLYFNIITAKLIIIGAFTLQIFTLKA